jgi:predicted ester cyclase
MGTEQDKANDRRFIEEVMNRGNLAVIDELSAPNFVDHSTPPGVPPTIEGLKGFLTQFRAAFPDLHYTVEDQIAEGDRIAMRVTGTGTMKGDFMGMPAANKSAKWSEIHITRWANGKAVEHWGVVDQMDMLAQLGFAQAPGQPAAAGSRI